MSLLSVNNLTTEFHTREGISVAVDNVSFSVERGKVLGIVGESGSGKSVCCYSLMGLVPSPPGKITSGSAEFDGVDLLKMNKQALRKVRGARIGMIFQDPMTSLNPHMTIANQLMESLFKHKKLDKKAAREKAIEALEEVGIRNARERIDSYPHEFSGGMRQRVMIAMALINEPELLIADEPTTALDVTVQAQILTLIKNLQQKRNLGVIFISHDLAVVGNMADQILVMKDGKVVEQGSAEKIFRSPEHEYTIKLLQAVPKSAKQLEKQYNEESSNFLQVINLKKTFSKSSGIFFKTATKTVAVDNISLDIKQGEILGLVGESGSGKSTLGRCIVRLLDSDSGQVVLDGQNLSYLPEKRLRASRKYFQTIFQDPYASLNPRMTVFDTIAEPLLLHGMANRLTVSEKVNTLMDEVGLARKFVRKYPHEFSGGQRQRIAIARAIGVQPKLIVADEPVSALDVTIQAQVLDLLLSLSKKYGLTMLFISHDLAVVRYVSDRVAVMRQGQIVELGDTEQVFHAPEHEYTQSLLSAIPRLDRF